MTMVASPPHSPSNSPFHHIRSPSPSNSTRFGEETLEELEDEQAVEEEHSTHALYILLAEFDIDIGASLTHQYPWPLGVDEHQIAELMLPDGVHKRNSDFTTFYLNQVPGNTVGPGLDITNLSTSDSASEDEKDAPLEEKEIMFVLSCVRMKEDSTVRRGAMVKALAIVTHDPYIQVYKPLLLLALEEYFNAPTPAILSTLFDTLNSIPTQGMPVLTRAEKLILRNTERRDVFEEKFQQFSSTSNSFSKGDDVGSPVATEGEFGEVFRYRRKSSLGASFSLPSSSSISSAARPRKFSTASTTTTSTTTTAATVTTATTAPSSVPTPGISSRKSSITNQNILRSLSAAIPSTPTQGGKQRDTHYWETSSWYKGKFVPVRIPLSVFPEEVGEYSLNHLITTFSPQTPFTFPAPFHPHLHTSGASTHPIILLLNALLTEKRILFLGNGRAAGEVGDYVLAACALGSGGGTVLRGMKSRAFVYANLNVLDMFTAVPGYVAGVTNPRFEDLTQYWDVLCNTETGIIKVSSSAFQSSLPLTSPPSPGHKSTKSLTSLSESLGRAGVEEIPPTPSMQSEPMVMGMSGGISGGGISNGIVNGGSANVTGKVDFAALGRAVNEDAIFMDEISSAIASHYGENVIRARFAEFITRFVRIAAKWEEETYGSSKIGWPTRSFNPRREGVESLGSGIVWSDESTKLRELQSNLKRIEGWRRSQSYELWKEDFQESLHTNAVRTFDLAHQVSRLRSARFMSDAEVTAIFTSLSKAIISYDEVCELLALLPVAWGGLLPLGFGLFHNSLTVREATCDLLDSIRKYPVGQSFFNSLNAFHRMAYTRVMKARSEREKSNSGQELPDPDETFVVNND